MTRLPRERDIYLTKGADLTIAQKAADLALLTVLDTFAPTDTASFDRLIVEVSEAIAVDPNTDMDDPKTWDEIYEGVIAYMEIIIRHPELQTK